MDAIYISSNTFTVDGDKSTEFNTGRRLKATLSSGDVFCTISGSAYSGVTDKTAVGTYEDELNATLESVLYGVVAPGVCGSLPDHDHTGSEGSGGGLTISGGSGGTLDHGDLTNLGYAASGHTGFSPDTHEHSTFSGTSSFVDGDATVTGTMYAHVYDSFSPLIIKDGGVTVIEGDGVGNIDFPEGATGAGASTFLDLTDTPITYSGTNGQYLVGTGTATEFVDLEKTQMFVDEAVPDGTTPSAANVGDYYIQSMSSDLYEKQSVEEIELLSDSFTGTTLNLSKWGTRTYPNASVTQDDFLELNNSTGGAHSGAHAYTKINFNKTGLIKLTCRWKPHANHYSSAAVPMVVFRHPTSFTVESKYGHATSNCLIVNLGSNGDTTNRTNISITGDSTAIDITENTWQDLVVSLNCNTREFAVDLNSGSYNLSSIISQEAFDNLSSQIKIELSTSDYNKSNTEGFDDVVITTQSLDAWDNLGGHTHSEIITTLSGLTDTPSGYDEGKYLQSTASGIVYEDIVLTSSGTVQWKLNVSDDGTLYTTAV